MTDILDITLLDDCVRHRKSSFNIVEIVDEYQEGVIFFFWTIQIYISFLLNITFRLKKKVLYRCTYWIIRVSFPPDVSIFLCSLLVLCFSSIFSPTSTQLIANNTAYFYLRLLTMCIHEKTVIPTDTENGQPKRVPSRRKSMDCGSLIETTDITNNTKQKRRSTLSTSSNIEQEVLPARDDSADMRSHTFCAANNHEIRGAISEDDAVSCISVDSTRRQVREVIDQRNLTLLKDDNEFRRIQAELKSSGMNTGMGSLQILDQKLTKALIEKKRRNSLDASEKESVTQRATKTIMKRRRSLSLQHTLQLESEELEEIKRQHSRRLSLDVTQDLYDLLLLTRL